MTILLRPKAEMNNTKYTDRYIKKLKNRSVQQPNGPHILATDNNSWLILSNANRQ